MKLFLKILAGIVIFLVIAVVALNLYFTDDRLRSMILPEAREMVGTEVQAEHISLTFFRTFPRLGVELEEFLLPDTEGDTVATLEGLLVGVELFPLLSNEISISELILDKPVLNYRVNADSSSNIDFLMEMGDEPADTTQEDGYAISIPNFTIESAIINYRDELSNSAITMQDLDADISLNFADLIESTIDAELASLSATIDSVNYIDDLSLSLNQTSTLDLENEIVEINEAILSIRGLALNVDGAISNWSGDPEMNINFSSSSENFGELLRLAPPEYDEQLANLDSRGSLLLEGSVSGTYTEEELPNFDLVLNVNDGYLKNPDLQDAIEDIQIQLSASNELVTIQEIQASAAENTITASGTVERPLEEDGTFSMNIHGDVDLGTVSRFYPIEEFDIQELGGLLTTNLNANGNLENPENAAFSGNFYLSDGMIQYAEVPQSIEHINANIQATQDLITFESAELTAADNVFSMAGTVSNPLDDETRAVDMEADLDFDLSTIKNFYPLDEDTLQISGQLVANVILKGRADPDHLEQVIQNSSLNLQNGYLEHEKIGQPLEDITLVAEASGTELTIREGYVKTGRNQLAVDGTVTNYLSDDPLFDISLTGDANLNDISEYYSLEPWIQELLGSASLDLNVAGPAGNPQEIQLNGSMALREVQATGDSLPLPVSDLRAELTATPQELNLTDFFMNFGETDISLQGEVRNYLGFLEENPSENQLPSITGSYSSDLLDMDEMIDWEDDSEEPTLIDLPEMNTSVSAEIGKLIVLGLEITDISGQGNITPNSIVLEDAQATLFEGTATGNMVWEVPQPDRTHITFEGGLEGLTAEAFFRDTGFLGEGSTIHEYLSGALSADISYASELDEMLSPDISSIEANGTFGMSRARLSGHPIQEQIANFVKADELSSLALDEWTSTFTIKDDVLSFSELNITSENIGIELSGTQHMLTDAISYNAILSLPARFKRGIASVLPEQAVDALQREDGTIAVPIRISGTTSSPRVGPDQDAIQKLVEDYLKERGGNLLDRLFGGDN